MTNRSRLDAALRAATDTRAFVVGPDTLREAPSLFSRHFDRQPRIVADPNTFAAAGRATLEHFAAANLPSLPPLVLSERAPHASDTTLASVRAALAENDTIAVAVGSGTINDLCKRASEELQRPYMVIATAASVDGYASFGAPIIQQGFKKTLPCRAPRVVLADTRVLAAAPSPMAAAGYADLAAKITGGSDWILADALDDDPIQPAIWEMIQTPLRGWIAHPARLATGDCERLEALFEGLTLCGFAMQATQSSRPASGAEHLFSHVWEMAGLTDPQGREPSHGFKVALGTLATTALTEAFLETAFDASQIEPAVAAYPDWPAREAFIRQLFEDVPLRDRILQESRAKHRTPAVLRERLHRLAQHWEKTAHRVRAQLVPFATLRHMLEQAGCPTHPAAIGLTPSRISASVFAAQMIRNRFTILDLAAECGRLSLLAANLGHAWSAPPAQAIP